MTRRRTAAATTAGVGFGTPGLVALLALLLVMATIVPAAAQWGDTEQATGEFQSATLEPPVIDSCVARKVQLLGNVVTLTWRFPTGTSPGFDPNNVVFRVDGQVLAPPTTGPNASGVYTTQFPAGLLGPLLGVLLGVSFEIGVATTQAEWESPQAASMFVNIPPVLLGGPTSCVITNP